ncbi:MAG: SRPBCC family protein, partial [bacterium]|nr:SRPBCC family protein [bacterium]
LGIPDDVTEIAMFPVAWTKGTDFRPARRIPARDITFFDGYGRIYESGPGSSVTMADGPGMVVETDIAAEVDDVWTAVTDIDLPAQFSDEFTGATWDEGFDGPVLGATFTGRNHLEVMGDWEVPCFVDVCERPTAFGWCTSDPDNPGARWRFEIQPLMGGGTRLLYRLLLGPGPSGLNMFIEQNPDKEHRIIANRLRVHRANMQRVVDGIKAHVEATDN